MPTTHKRTCHLCEANCGIIIEAEDRKVMSVKGNPDHVLSGGYICPKATAIPDIQDDPDRLRKPLKRTGDQWSEITFEQAYAEIADRLVSIKATGKRASLYLGNPTAHNYSLTTQMRTLYKAIELQGVYSASTLDQLPHMLAQKWVYGHNALYPVADIDHTNYMLIIGGNPAASNGSLWTVPNARGRIKALRARGGKVVVIDPRRTETADLADAHHFIKPGTDTALLLGLLLALDEADLIRPGRLEPLLDDGWAHAWDAIRAFDIKNLSDYCGVSIDVMRDIASNIGADKPAIVYGRLGVSVTQFGTLNHWLIQLLNIAGGNLDRKGGVLFNQPVVDFVETSGTGSYGRYRSRLSDQPEVLGELPTAELADDITTPGEGQIGALFTIAGNPVLSSPGGRQLDEALAGLDLMVSIDFYRNETTRHAHYILPPCGPLEKDHYPLFLAPLAVRNFTAYSPALFEKEPGTKADWEIVYEMSSAINAARGADTPPVVTPRDALAGMLKKSAYDLTLADLDAAPDGVDFGPLKPSIPERLKTDDQRIHCAPGPLMKDLARFKATLKDEANVRFRLIGRRHLRSNNSWLHNAYRLVKGPNRCTLMIHPDDAAELSLTENAMARISNHVGAIELPVEITDAMMTGVVSIPHGFGHDRDNIQLSVAGAHAGASINDLTDPAEIDPLSGNATLNGTPVEIVAV